MSLVAFVDTSAFMARYLPDDPYHALAVQEHERLMKAGYRYVTSNYIFDETVTGVQRRASHRRARMAGDAIRNHPRLLRYLVDEGVETDAWELHLKFDDQPISFTDATTMALMRARGITEIFTFDSDFDRVGLVRLPRPR